MIEVVNKYRLPKGEQAQCIYIGRGSPLGNPYKLKPHGPYERGETLELYREWLPEQARRDPAIRAALNEIWLRVVRGELVRLLCFCKPAPCHGDIIKELVESKLPYELRSDVP